MMNPMHETDVTMFLIIIIMSSDWRSDHDEILGCELALP
jgi:hypothetical protein